MVAIAVAITAPIIPHRLMKQIVMIIFRIVVNSSAYDLDWRLFSTSNTLIIGPVIIFSSIGIIIINEYNHASVLLSPYTIEINCLPQAKKPNKTVPPQTQINLAGESSTLVILFPL